MKEFNFSVCTGFINNVPQECHYTIMEDDLEDHHIKLLLGELMQKFNDSPDLVKEKFMSNSIDAWYKTLNLIKEEGWK